MSKTLLLIFLTIIYASLCRNSLQFLSDSQTEGQMEPNAIKGIIQGLQVFKDISCPADCDITEQQSLDLLDDLIRIGNIVSHLISGVRDLENALPILKERFVDLVRIYLELVPNCKDAVPAVQQRVHEILAHMSGLEYVLKTVFTIVIKQEEYYDQITDAITTCYNVKDAEDAKRCGVKIGAAIHDVLLWDFKH
jgi:hypothetical protein